MVNSLTHIAKIICWRGIKIYLWFIKWMRIPIKTSEYKSKTKFELKLPTVPKKSLFIKLHYKGYNASKIIIRCIRKDVKNTLNAARLCSFFFNRRIVSSQNKDKLPSSPTSMCNYHFNCCCGANYIGQNTSSDFWIPLLMTDQEW